MNEDISDDWQAMATAPRDGTRILVAVHESEQGPAEVDLVAWRVPPLGAEEAWVATDSQPDLPVTYAEGELAGWMPLPQPTPALRTARTASRRRKGAGEIDGSSI